MLSKEYLESCHTRQLLGILNNLRGLEIYFNDANNKEVIEEINLVKEVLATREHVPNKKEAKIIRQEAAKRKK